MSKILVTGGSGMVGRHLQEIMPNATYTSSIGYNLTMEDDVERMFAEIRPNIVIHLAAKVGGMFSNINKPAEFFDENILMNTLVVKHARIFGVKRLIGFLSSCIYPDVTTYPMTEDMLHQGPPTQTNFAYACAKRSLAVQIDSYNKQYGTKYSYLTPCNLYGEYDKFDENSHFVPALIKKVIEAKKNGSDHILLFGSGKPLRQFMYAMDLAKVIKHCIENNITDNFNVATNEVYSIDEIAKIALKACDAEHLNIVYDTSKPDGQFRKDISSEKLLKIIPDFKPTTLFDGIQKIHNHLK